MNKNVIIFDFDGTIADTHGLIIEISNRLSKEFNFNQIDPHEYEFLKDKTSREVIDHLKVPVMKIPAILAKAKKEFRQEVLNIKPFLGLKDILIRLKGSDLKMGILSSNTLENIHRFMHNHRIDAFEFIHTTSKVWSKNTSLKKVVEKYGFRLDQILYIGDEIRDIVAAKKTGIEIAAVTWGYNSKKVLKDYEPDFIANTPEELFEICVRRNIQ